MMEVAIWRRIPTSGLATNGLSTSRPVFIFNFFKNRLFACSTMAPSITRLCRSVALSTWLVSSLCSVHLLCLDFTVAGKEEWYTAFVNITYLDPLTARPRSDKSECGRYGEHSPKREARGLVLAPSLPQDRQMCEPAVGFPPASRSAAAWVALVAAGNCTYREKIRNAASHNASAVVVYNVGSSGTNDTITMPHSGTGDIVAIMIPEHKGREIMALLEQNIAVTLHITVGTRNLQKDSAMLMPETATRDAWGTLPKKPSASFQSGPLKKETRKPSATLTAVPYASSPTSLMMLSGCYLAGMFSISTAWTPGCMITRRVPCVK